MARLARPLLIGLITLALAACGGGNATAPTPGEGFFPPTMTLAEQPSLPPLSTLTALPGAPSDESGSPADMPIDVAGYELIAIRAGESVYSGYTCAIASVGCSCELPVVQRATFEFVSESTMKYTFSGGGYGAEWLLTRLGVNQWSYEIAMVDEQGGKEGVYFVLLTFTQDGFLITQGADLDEGGMVVCPDVNFRRVQSGGTPEP